MLTKIIEILLNVSEWSNAYQNFQNTPEGQILTKTCANLGKTNQHIKSCLNKLKKDIKLTVSFRFNVHYSWRPIKNHAFPVLQFSKFQIGITLQI